PLHAEGRDGPGRPAGQRADARRRPRRAGEAGRAGIPPGGARRGIRRAGGVSGRRRSSPSAHGPRLTHALQRLTSGGISVEATAPEGRAMRSWIPAGVLTVALGCGVAAAASAWLPLPPACLPPPSGFEGPTVTVYLPEYRTEYREVQHVVNRCVP